MYLSMVHDELLGLGKMLNFRKAKKEDLTNGLFDLLQSSFTRYPRQLDIERVHDCFDKIISQNSIIICAVLTKDREESIIGTAKVLIEYKLHNNLAKMAHIEDVCVAKEHQNQGLGIKLVNYCIENYCQDCYKIVLSCKDNLEQFYKNNKFMKTGIAMSLYNS